MLLAKVQINKSQLISIPENERVFFLKTCNILNEFNILQKMASFSNKDDKNETLRKAQNSQTFFILMELSSKLFEAWNMIKNDFFSSGISRQYDPLLSDDAKESLEEIKRYFATDNIIKKMRNKFVSHLDSDEINNSFDTTPADEVFELYFSETYANCFFYITNIMISYNILNTIDESNHTKALETLFDEVLTNTKLLQRFLGTCVQLVEKKYLSNSKREEITITDGPSIDEISVPWFVERRKT